MNEPGDMIYVRQAAEAFDSQSSMFDEIYSGHPIIEYKRQRVRDHVERFIPPQSQILELNAGTGEDAIYFARRDYRVHATDISEGMQKILLKKIIDLQVQDRVTLEICSFTQLENLKNKGPYDLIFSNFAGLNCTNQLPKVLHSFSSLLKKNGIVTLVILPQFCLWELLLVFKGKFKTAFRRFFSNRGRRAHIEGKYFQCWYYNPSLIRKYLGLEFDILQTEGLCSFVPPSYIRNFADKHPTAFNVLKKMENKWKSKWPWKTIGDYYIISLRKRLE